MPRARNVFVVSLICGGLYVLESQGSADLDCVHSDSLTVPILLQSLPREHGRDALRNTASISELQEALQFQFKANINAIAKPFHDQQNGSRDLSLPLPGNESATSFTGTNGSRDLSLPLPINESATSFTDTGVRTFAEITKPTGQNRRGAKRSSKGKHNKHSVAISKISTEAEVEMPKQALGLILEAKRKTKKADSILLKAKATLCVAIIILVFVVLGPQLRVDSSKLSAHVKDDAIDQEETITIAQPEPHAIAQPEPRAISAGRRHLSGNRHGPPLFAGRPSERPPAPPQASAFRKEHHAFQSFGTDAKR